MATKAQQHVHVPPIHPSILSLVTQRLGSDVGRSPEATPTLDVALHDYGIKYRLIISKESQKSWKVDLHSLVPGWEDVSSHALPQLRSLYGANAVLERKCHGNELHEDYDVLIRIFSDKLPSPFASGEMYARKLSEIRVQILGAPIRAALNRLLQKPSEADGTHAIATTLPLHRSASGCRGSCHLLGTYEKVMAIFKVDFQDETERALARLFLQQFAEAQRKVSQSPHCEYRRGMEPPKDIPVQEKQNIAGYLSFTFFPSHVQADGRCEKAVQLLVNFFVFMERHVKTSKTFMSSRMRQKKDDLLSELGKKPRTECRTLFKKIAVRRTPAATGKQNPSPHK